MIQGGNATVSVTNLDRSIAFYRDTLGLKLKKRFGNEWAEIDAGGGLTIGLHPANGQTGAGRRGSTVIALSLTIPIERAIVTLKARGVVFSGHVNVDPNAPVKVAYFQDCDGNDLYICETVLG